MSSQNESPAGRSDASQAQPAPAGESKSKDDGSRAKSREHGGPKGLEPTRYGDWEKQGRCIDF